jgi:hypothetical protein
LGFLVRAVPGRRHEALPRGRRFVQGALAFSLIAMISGATIPISHAQDAPDLDGLFIYTTECDNIAVKSGWGRIGLPHFGVGEQRVHSYSVDAWNKRRLFVSNGFEIFRSMDGGCSWEKVYELPSEPSQQSDLSQLDSRIRQVVIPEGTTADDFVYFVVDQLRPPEEVTSGMRTRVFRSDNNGDDWIAADGALPDALPPHGAPEQLLPTPAFPKVLYLLLESPDVQYMATSHDGGETWQTRGPKCVAPVLPERLDTPATTVEDVPGPGCIDPDENSADPPAPSDFTGMAVDPFQPNDLWLFGPRGLERSLNSGTTPHKVEDVTEPIGAVDVFRVAGQDSRVLAAAAGSPNLYVSQDGGETWETETAPGFVESIAKGRQAQEYALATDRGVYLSLYGMQFPVGPPDRRITQIKSARATGGRNDMCLYGSSGTHLEVACALLPPPQPPDPPREVPPLHPSDVHGDGAAVFDPENYETTLDRGESEVVPYTLRINKSPTPLDVYFLIDISGSMQNTIDGVSRGLQDIINELGENNINTEFGLGVFRAYENPPAYARRVQIQPPGEELARVLGNLIASSGGEETQLEALYQSATGEGRDWAGNLLDVGQLRAHVDKDQEARFREEALKVIVIATDEAFPIAPPRPSFDDVIGALNGNDIEQVGLAMQEPGTGGSAEDAELPNTTPRAAGRVDCDGDGVPELFRDDPLVCEIDPDKAYKARLMSGAIVQLLEEMQRIGDVQVNVVEAPPGVVPNMESRLFTGIDFTDPTELEFDVMFTCPAGTEEDRFEVKFNAVALNMVLAETTATVRCTSESAPPELPPPPPPDEIIDPGEPDIPAAFFPFPAFVPPIVRPPEVSPNPGPQSQTQTQAQNQAQMQNAMAKQKQEQVQLALAYSQSLKAEVAAERAGDDLNMSKYRSTSTRRQQQMPPGLILMLSASAMSMAFGLAARRFRTQPEPARRNRRFR